MSQPTKDYANLLNSVLDRLRSLTTLKRSPKGDGWDAICPFPDHEDTIPSFKVWDNGGWYCLGCGRGGNLALLSEMLGGIQPTDPLSQSSKRRSANTKSGSWKDLGIPIAEYIYRSESGQPLYKVVRYVPKAFLQMRWDGSFWRWGLKGTRRVLYNLHLMAKYPTATIVMVEGEKDCDLLTRHGILSSTCPMGAGKWRGEYGESLRGRKVILIPDNDEVGITHMMVIQTYLTKNKIADAKLVRIPEQYKDVSEWGQVDKVKEMIEL